jgi:hypothetical protein
MSLEEQPVAIAIEAFRPQIRKDTAMLYVFNSANGVQIAWNNVLPSQKAGAKRPSRSLITSIVRTASAG